MYHGRDQVCGIGGASLIENCFNTGDITASRYYASGITQSGSLIYNCYNTGTVKGNFYSAGIAAYLITGKMVNCYSIDNGTEGGRCALVYQINAGNEVIIANCFSFTSTNVASRIGGIVQNNRATLKLYNCYSISDSYVGSSTNGLINSNSGTVEINKCYYLKTQYITRAMPGVADADLDVEGVESISGITAAKLNANISSIPDLGEDVELVEWIDGPDGYPILNFQLPLSTETE